MNKIKFGLLSLLAAVIFAGCASAAPVPAPTPAPAAPGLAGAWQVAVIRATGNGVVLLTFTSDGTFFRSGDTHPVLSVAHGVWKKIGDGQYDGAYTALRFDDNKKFIGYQKTRLRITASPDGNKFTATAKVSTQDLDGKETATSESQLTGQRMEVESFQ